ncbi:N-glycosidase YbiA [Diplonema papillatum]|nr:N-glycosidase YbiA [Diplonema papillatum]
MTTAAPGYLLFYRTRDENGCFSNFSAHSFTADGRTWKTSEHYFQAMKFAGTPDLEEVARTGSPGEAARAGRDRSRPLRKDWEAVKEDVMRAALRAKFTQNGACYEALMATRGLFLVEHTVNDAYWGDGGDMCWTCERAAAGECLGKNRLGTLLTELRTELERDAVSDKPKKVSESSST